MYNQLKIYRKYISQFQTMKLFLIVINKIRRVVIGSKYIKLERTGLE